MARVTESRQPRSIGTLMVQDHDRRVSLKDRAAILCVRKVDREDSGSYVLEENTAGDLVGLMLWQNASRPMPGWAAAWPVVVGGGLGGARGGVSPAAWKILADGVAADSTGAEKALFSTRQNPLVPQLDASTSGQFGFGHFSSAGPFNLFFGGTGLFGLGQPAFDVGSLISGSIEIRAGESVVRSGITGGILGPIGGAAGGQIAGHIIGAPVEAKGQMPPPIVAPMKDGRWLADLRYRTKVPSIAEHYPQFPIGFHGIVMMGTEETVQTEQFHPTDPRIMAPNIGGPPTMGSYVCDLVGGTETRDPAVRIQSGGSSGVLEVERMARVQSAWRVIKGPTYPFQQDRSSAAGGVRPAAGETVTSSGLKETTNTLAWQLGLSGQGDTAGGYCIDREVRIKTGVLNRPTSRRGPVSGTGPDKGFGGTQIGSGGALKAGGGAGNFLAPGGVSFIPGVGWVQADFANKPSGPGGTFQSKILAGGLGDAFRKGEAHNPVEIYPSSRIGAVRGEIEGAPLVIGMAGVADGGPLDPGGFKDVHNLAHDADGNPINPLHVSIDALYRNRSNPKQDGPLLFEHLAFVEGSDNDIPTRVHLTWDARVNYWRWFSSSVFETIIVPPPPPDDPVPPPPGRGKPPTTPGEPDPPPPPPDDPPPPTTPGEPDPPTAVPPGTGSGIPGTPGTPPPSGGGGGGGGDPVPAGGQTAILRDVGGVTAGASSPQLYHAAAAAVGLGTVVFRPQQYSPGQLDLRHARGVAPWQREAYNDRTPVVLRIDTFGAQGGKTGGPHLGDDSGGAHGGGAWSHTEEPGESRFRGGTAPGGIVFQPGEVDLSDVDEDLAPDWKPVSTSYVALAPGVCLAFGVPELAGGVVRDGYSVRDVGGVLTFASLNSTGVGTDRVTFTAAGALAVDAGIVAGDDVGVPTGFGFKVASDVVVTDRVTGWAAATGTATRTAFATSTVTTEQLAERVKAMIDDFGMSGSDHLLIGA